jgi:hypothetical protein
VERGISSLERKPSSTIQPMAPSSSWRTLRSSTSQPITEATAPWRSVPSEERERRSRRCPWYSQTCPNLGSAVVLIWTTV